MFIEPIISGEKRGWIEVICGSMFSGKTEELIRRIKRAKIANQYIQIFKPEMDHRYHQVNIVSHDENAISSHPVVHAKDMLAAADKADVIGIDEAQFFDKELPRVCDKLALSGIRVIVAGLDMDFRGKPFGPMPDLLAKADYITKLHAICVRCGNIASFSYRKTADKERLMLGELDVYEPRCRKCFFENE